jgi:hypothetical protein
LRVTSFKLKKFTNNKKSEICGKMKFVVVIVILTIALTVVWSAGDNQYEEAGDNQDEDAVYSQDENAVDRQDEDPGDNQDEDDDQDHSIWPTHEFIVKQVGTPTLPTAIPLKPSSSMRATLVFNLFFK